VTLPAFVAARRDAALLLLLLLLLSAGRAESIDISGSLGPQQQTRMVGRTDK